MVSKKCLHQSHGTETGNDFMRTTLKRATLHMLNEVIIAKAHISEKEIPLPLQLN
jgi:hypothetical protein